MKIHQLPMGARFEYEGQEYVKTGPMFATGKAGQRLIPKYAVLKLLGETPEVPPAPQRKMLPRDEVLGAFEAFYAECRTLISAERHAALDNARNRFLRSIEGAPGIE